MTEEQKQLMEEMKSMAQCLRAAKIDFIITLNIGQEGEMHNISTNMNVEDNHHVLDLLASIMECWDEGNDKASEDDVRFLTMLAYLMEIWWKANHK